MAQPRIPHDVQTRVFELTLALHRVTDFFPPNEAVRRHLRDKANDILGLVNEYGIVDWKHETMLILGKIRAIKGYLGIARSLDFVRPVNITVLEREYDFLADFLTSELERARMIAIPEMKPKQLEEPTETSIEFDELPTWEEFTAEPETPEQPEMSNPGENSFGRTVSDIDAAMRDRSESPAVVKTAAPSEHRGVNERQKKILHHLEQNGRAKISDFFALFVDISSKTIQRDLQDMVSKSMLKKEGEKRWTIYSLK